MAAGARDRAWLEELVRLGGSIHQDDAPPLTDEEDAVQQAGIERYLAMLDEFDTEPPAEAETIEAVLWSLHPIDDYGIYESAYGVLSTVTDGAYGSAVARVLPQWLRGRGDHDSIAAASWPLAERPESREAFLAVAAGWSDEERLLVVAAVERWNRDVEGWEPVLAALGAPVVSPVEDVIPEEWPADWIAAAVAFRAEGRVDRAWLDQGDPSADFPRVLALLELGHGVRWREVPDLLNPLFIRRRGEIPGFIDALAALPSPRRERIIDAVGAARPDTAAALRSLLAER
jgi:hypothetical protein